MPAHNAATPTSPIRMRRLLLLASERYSLPILQPVADVAHARGDQVAWLAAPAIAAHLPDGAHRLRSQPALQAFKADATLATVHRIAPQLPGLHVQLFHGLSIDKRDPGRGHFRVRGLFDLYCTHGPATTAPFETLARTHRHFAVRETGWPKLDPLFAGDRSGAHALRTSAGGRPVVMLASTFTASLSAARDLLPQLRDWVARGDRHWLLTLHPKSDPALIAAYRALDGAHATWLESDRLLDMLLAADVLVCDTSSVIEEACLVGVPVVTVRTRVPKAFMIDVAEARDVDAAVGLALQRDAARMQAMDAYARSIHPQRDGHASRRVLEAIDDLLDSNRAGLERRPFNAWRRLNEAARLRQLLNA